MYELHLLIMSSIYFKRLTFKDGQRRNFTNYENTRRCVILFAFSYCSCLRLAARIFRIKRNISHVIQAVSLCCVTTALAQEYTCIGQVQLGSRENRVTLVTNSCIQAI